MEKPVQWSLVMINSSQGQWVGVLLPQWNQQISHQIHQKEKKTISTTTKKKKEKERKKMENEEKDL